MEWFGLAGTYKDHVVQTTFHGQGHLSQDQAAQRPCHPDLEHFRDGASKASLGILFQCLNTIIVKIFSQHPI